MRPAAPVMAIFAHNRFSLSRLLACPLRQTLESDIEMASVFSFIFSGQDNGFVFLKIDRSAPTSNRLPLSSQTRTT